MVLEDSITLKSEALQAAFAALPADEQARLRALCERLAAILKEGNPQRVVGPVVCLEILGKLGMWMAEAGNGHDLA